MSTPGGSHEPPGGRTPSAPSNDGQSKASRTSAGLPSNLDPSASSQDDQSQASRVRAGLNQPTSLQQPQQAAEREPNRLAQDTLGSLEADTPVAPIATIAELRERRRVILKVQAEMKAQQEQEQARLSQERKRKDALSPLGTSSKRQRQANTSGDDMGLSSLVSNEPIDYREMAHFRYSDCSFSINGGPIMGSPWVKSVGWVSRVRLEPGHLGKPCIIFILRVNIGDKNILVNQNDPTSFAETKFSWSPGRRAAEAPNSPYMINDFECQPALSLPVDTQAKHQQQFMGAPKGARPERFYYLTFKMASLNRTAFIGKHWAGLPDLEDVLQSGGLNRLLNGNYFDPQVKLEFWFAPRGNYIHSYEQKCLRFIRRAYIERHDVYRQYNDQKPQRRSPQDQAPAYAVKSQGQSQAARKLLAKEAREQEAAGESKGKGKEKATANSDQANLADEDFVKNYAAKETSPYTTGTL